MSLLTREQDTATFSIAGTKADALLIQAARIMEAAAPGEYLSHISLDTHATKFSSGAGYLATAVGYQLTLEVSK